MNGVHLAGQGGFGLGSSTVYAGAGGAVGLKEGVAFPKFNLNAGLGGLGLSAGEGPVAGNTWTEPIEGQSEVDDNEGWFTVDESEAVEPQSSGLFGLQGGIGLGPLKVNAGIGAGR